MKGLPCVYCRRPATTKDHVPPRSLFPAGVQLITVPCCEECRKIQSKDDEYIRLALVTRLDLDDHPDIEGITDRALRALEKPEARRLKAMALKSVAKSDIYSTGG